MVFRYSSINVHEGVEPSRRDDLEATGAAKRFVLHKAFECRVVQLQKKDPQMDGWIDWLGCLADWQVDIEIDNIDVYQDAVSRSPVCTNQPVTLYPKDNCIPWGPRFGQCWDKDQVSGCFRVFICPRLDPGKCGSSVFQGYMLMHFLRGQAPQISRWPDCQCSLWPTLGSSWAARWPTLAGPESKVQEVQAQGHQRCPSRDGAWHGDGTGPKLGGSMLHPKFSLETLKISDVYEYVDCALLKMIKVVVALLHHHGVLPNSYGYVNHLECARIMRYYLPMVRCKFSASHFFLQLVWRGCWQVSADSRCQTRHVRRRTLKHGCI